MVNKEKYLKLIAVAVIVIELMVIFGYPILNTHTDILTVQGIEIWGDKRYHIMTEELILNVSKYWYDDLLVGHTYRIKWVDGVWVDRILEFEELRSSGW